MSVLGEPNFAAWTAQRGMSGAFGGNLTVVDKVPPEMLYLVDPHWYQYPPLNPLWHGILGFVIGVVGVVAMAGNFMVIYIFCGTKALRTPSNLLVVNLAFSDFFMIISMSPPMVINCYYETWILGPLMCELYGMTGSLFGCTSIWTMTLIALDRYNVIVKGLSAKPLTKKGALLRITLVWLFALFWTLCPFFGWNRNYLPTIKTDREPYHKGGNRGESNNGELEKHISVWLFARSEQPNRNVFLKLAVIALASIACFMIRFPVRFNCRQAVAAHEKSMREQAKKMNVATLRSGDAANTSAECKLAKVALMTITLWFMAWTPYLVTNYTGILHLADITPLGTIWCSLFAKANAIYNPIVYAISHPKYKQALHKKFPSLSCGAPPEADTKSTTSAATTATGEEKATA